MKRFRLTEPTTFDLPIRDTILRVRIDEEGLTIWRKATGNLDTPRAYDQYIKVSWEKVGMAGTCYVGSKTGHYEKGPAAGRAGLTFLTRLRRKRSTK